MKINLKSIFGIKSKVKHVNSNDNEEIDYDKYVDFYYTNLINSIILFSFTRNELEKLSAPSFDPIFELESEIDYAFLPVCFDTIFRNNVIDISLKNELLEFKQETDNISSEIWNWEFIDNHESWITVKQKASILLDKLGIVNRVYNATL